MIKILSAAQTREADAFTIEKEPIKSIDLMERAVTTIYQACGKRFRNSACLVFCGTGNNGGDGLALARMLHKKCKRVSVFILDAEKKSDDFKTNLKRLEKAKVKIRFIRSENEFPPVEEGNGKVPDTVIIDALFGTGLSKPLSGLAAQLVSYLNTLRATRIAIDVPSGLAADHWQAGHTFQADETYTFQAPKLAFLFPENARAVGRWQVLDIGLDPAFIASLPSNDFLPETTDVSQRLKPRLQFDHKGKFGHALIHAGSEGKMGAAILCARACVNSGAGLTTVHVPDGHAGTINLALPEAMTEMRSAGQDLNRYNAFAFGPGLGTGQQTAATLLDLLSRIHEPVVLDADALNILSQQKDPQQYIPEDAILTPHLKEFERLAGATSDWETRHARQVAFSISHRCYLILKGAYSCITTPGGSAYFNQTGNPGMAKGGSGDVLTGIIVSLLAQGYSPEDACLVGTHLHGLAADLAITQTDVAALTASRIIDHLGDALHQLRNHGQRVSL